MHATKFKVLKLSAVEIHYAVLVVCAHFFHLSRGWVKITEEGYSHAWFMIKRQVLQVENVCFALCFLGSPNKNFKYTCCIRLAHLFQLVP